MKLFLIAGHMPGQSGQTSVQKSVSKTLFRKLTTASPTRRPTMIANAINIVVLF